MTDEESVTKKVNKLEKCMKDKDARLKDQEKEIEGLKERLEFWRKAKIALVYWIFCLTSIFALVYYIAPRVYNFLLVNYKYSSVFFFIFGVTLFIILLMRFFVSIYDLIMENKDMDRLKDFIECFDTLIVWSFIFSYTAFAYAWLIFILF